ncbi:LAME_0F04016g1_1 [Lachancea meyersii CBS 8951]|uniref:LAME_0F04016g1_1 n=1 Tax=Lachancea meyersii CBS 8951 TaxID=1266667 RepID=A0A1G4JS35_9SACH|nr:LAME_0F04016g1_1 [Lachancea meyersii CBS 8951]
MTQRSSIPLVTLNDKQYSVQVEAEDDHYLSFSLDIERAQDSGPPTFCKDLLCSDTEIIVLDSIKSGIGRTLQSDFCANIIEPIFKELQVPTRIYRTKSSDSVGQFASTFKTTASTAIFIFLSGDTTISEFLNCLDQTPTTANNSQKSPALWFLPLPFGTANAWATSLGIKSPVAAFGQLLQNELSPQSFPLYKASFPNANEVVFFIIFSIGFHANLLHLCKEERFHNIGVEKFRIAAQEILQTYQLDYPLHIPSESSPLHFAYFTLINTPFLEKTYMPSPSSDPLKSQLHLLGYLTSFDKTDLVEKIMRGYRNKAQDDISRDGVIYRPLEDDFDIFFGQTPDTAPSTGFEICCDGHLLNMPDLQPEGKEFDGKVNIKFLKQYSAFDLKVLVPKI